MNTDTRQSHRARWAAIGAAVAVALGAGGIGIASATSPSGASAFVGTEPCRIVDTRPGATHIGPYDTLGPDSTITVEASGDVGECTGATALPADSTGLQLNITPIGATRATYLAAYPGAGEPPNASSLNPAPGQRPIPNAVTVELDSSGRFSIYNLAGSVDVAVDVVGRYTDHHHDDRYYTESQSDNRYYTKAQSDNRYYTKAQSDGRYYTQTESDARYLAADDALNITGIAANAGVSVNWGLAPPNTIAQLNVVTEAQSVVILLLTGEVNFGGASTVDCDVTTGNSLTNSYTFVNPTAASEEAFSLHQHVTVGAGTTTFNLNCHATANGATVGDVRFSAMHQPT